MSIQVHPTALLAICDYAKRSKGQAFFGILWGKSDPLEVVDSFELPETPELSFVEEKATLLGTMRPDMCVIGWYHCGESLELDKIPSSRRELLCSFASSPVVMLLHLGHEMVAFRDQNHLNIEISYTEAEEAVLEDVLETVSVLNPSATIVPFAAAARSISEYLERPSTDMHIVAKAAKAVARIKQMPPTVNESTVVAELIGTLILDAAKRTRALTARFNYEADREPS